MKISFTNNNKTFVEISHNSKNCCYSYIMPPFQLDPISRSFSSMVSILSEITGESRSLMVQVLGVQHTNSFQINQDGLAARIMVGGKVSRINHSCVPNMPHQVILKEGSKFHEQHTDIC